MILMDLYGCQTSTKVIQEDPMQPAITEVVKQPTSVITQSKPDPKVNTDKIVSGPVPPVNKKVKMYYYVLKGDNLWKISKKIYGKGSQWSKLAEMNKLKTPELIYAGDFIHYELLESSKNFADTYENTTKSKVLVKKGDTLSSISKQIFGNAANWRVLWKENPQIKNPDKLGIGKFIYFKQKINAIKSEIAPHEEKKKEEIQNESKKPAVKVSRMDNSEQESNSFRSSKTNDNDLDIEEIIKSKDSPLNLKTNF